MDRSTASRPRTQILDRLIGRLSFGQIGLVFLLGGLFSAVTTLSFAWLADEVLENTFLSIDNGLLLWIHGFNGPAATAVMFFFTTIGGPWVVAVFAALAAIWLGVKRHWIEMGGVLTASIGCALLNTVLKDSFARARPSLFTSPIHLTTYSFPSGHAMGSMVVFGILAFLLCRRLKRPIHRVLVIIATAIVVLLVGISRMYFGVHFPTDILGGYLAAALWLTITIMGMKFAEWHAQRTHSNSAS